MFSDIALCLNLTFQSKYTIISLFLSQLKIYQMSNKLTKETLGKILAILLKQQHLREHEQNHFLSVTFKKNIVLISNVLDWQMMVKCIQCLEVHDHRSVRRKNIDWIFVLEGSFMFHGMIFGEGEQFSISINDLQFLQFQQGSTYTILTHEAKRKAEFQSRQRMLLDKRSFLKDIIFGNERISQRDFHNFWQASKKYHLKKDQQFNTQQMDDSIFVVLHGSVNLGYQWKRLINIRELCPGSIFSTYLGRYIYKTNRQVKNAEKYLFKTKCVEPAIIISFSPDIFFEDQRFVNYKFIISKAWKLYSERVQQMKRIIQRIGLMRPQKKEVIKDIKEEIQVKYLKERIMSVPVAIEKRKLRKIAYSMFQERSTLRKVQNISSKSMHTLESCETRSTQKIDSARLNETINIDRVSNKLSLGKLSTAKQTIVGSKFGGQSLNKTARQFRSGRGIKFGSEAEPNILKHHRTLSTRGKTQSIDFIDNEIQRIEETEKPFYNFFRPQEFISKKLKIHYESVLMRMQTIKIPLTVQEKEEAQEKDRKKYLQEYINQRRILKLGPKKRLLYKQRRGF